MYTHRIKAFQYNFSCPISNVCLELSRAPLLGIAAD